MCIMREVHSCVVFSGDISISDDITREPVEYKYRLEVQALDSGTPRRKSTAVIKVKVPEITPPKIDVFSTTMTVAENEPAGTLVGSVAVKGAEVDGGSGEADGSSTTGKFVYSIIGMNGRPILGYICYLL